MPYRRWIAIALLVIQIMTLARMTDTRVVPGLLLAALAVAAVPRVRLRGGTRGVVVAGLILAIVFIAEGMLWPLPARTFSPLMSSTSARGIAQFFIALQIVHLAQYKHALPRHYPLLAITALAFIGSVVDYGRMYFGFELSAVVSVVLLLGYFMVAESDGTRTFGMGIGYYGLRGLAILFVVVLGLSVAFLLKRYQEDLDLVFSRFVNYSAPTTRAGLSDMSQLDSVTQFRSRNENGVALRVVSGGAPGYLRSRIYSQFRGNQWGFGVNRWRREPEPVPGGGVHGINLFTIRRAPLDHAAALEMWPAHDASGRLFAPLDATAFRVRGSQIVLDDHGAVEAPDFRQGESYTVYVPEDSPGPSTDDAVLAAALQLPEALDPAIHAVASKLFTGKSANASKMAAVLDYFSGFEYRLGTSMPRHRDPLTYFLTERPPAHCEYFATGAVVLLRAGGVPARYVTGFVPTEYNRFDATWVARNKDAHAWVEAYDPERGWMTLDPTPSAGQPYADPRSEFGLIWDAMVFEFTQFVAHVRVDAGAAAQELFEGLSRLLLASIIAARYGVFAVAAGASVALVAMVRRRRRARCASRAMSVELRHMERVLRRRRVVRGRSETLHRFAARLERDHETQAWAREAAKWYRDYATRRYGGR